MAPAFGNAKYSDFDGGDSIILATDLEAAYNELISRYRRAVATYNSANPALLLPLPDTNIDPETSTKTSTFSVLASKVYNVATRVFDTVYATYVEPYSGWTTPTTGNLQGCTTISEALVLLATAMKQCYDLLQPNPFVADPSGLATLTDGFDGNIDGAISLVVDESFDAITGVPGYVSAKLLTILDGQQGV